MYQAPCSHRVCPKLTLFLPSLIHLSCSSEDFLLSKLTEENSSNMSFPFSYSYTSHALPFPSQLEMESGKTLVSNHTAFYKTHLLSHYTQPTSIPIFKPNKNHPCVLVYSSQTTALAPRCTHSSLWEKHTTTSWANHTKLQWTYSGI